MPKFAWMGRVFKRTAGWLYTGAVHKTYPPGRSLALLSREAILPDDLRWAGGVPTIAGAFAGFADVVEQAGANTLSPKVRTVVLNHIQSWSGEDPGLSRQWVEQVVEGLDADLVAVLTWASFTAARKVGRWLWTPALEKGELINS